MFDDLIKKEEPAECICSQSYSQTYSTTCPKVINLTLTGTVPLTFTISSINQSISMEEFTNNFIGSLLEFVHNKHTANVFKEHGIEWNILVP